MKVQAYNSNINTSFRGKENTDASFVYVYNATPVSSLLPVKHPFVGLEDINIFSILSDKIKALFSPEVTQRAQEIDKSLDTIIDSSIEIGQKINKQA